MTDEKKEKMTALIPSVGAGGGQPPLCSETIKQIISRMATMKALKWRKWKLGSGKCVR